MTGETQDRQLAEYHPPSGTVRAVRTGGVNRALGIRYAVAERFGLPTAAPDRRDPFEATNPAPACPQLPAPFLDEILGTRAGELGGDEHCQRLSVTTPADAHEGAQLPVMVWFHGGSYAVGAGDLAIFDPGPLVGEQRVVVVSVTYRLGVLGYLGTAAGRPANLGLLDQLEALRWVQRNIAAFGGDPDQVTVFGQSAGGDAVAHLMATQHPDRLFARAIIQSAPFGLLAGREKMTAAMGAAADSLTPQTSRDDLMATQVQIAQAGRGFGLRSAMPFGVQYGHDPLPTENEVEATWSAAAPRIPVLVGYTRDEVRLYLKHLPVLTGLRKLPLLGRQMDHLVSRALTHLIYGRGAAAFARRHAEAGGAAWAYEISWSAPGNWLGAAHTIDMPLLFGTEDTWTGARIVDGASWEEIDRAARLTRALWGRFARGDDLGESGNILGVLEYRRVRAGRFGESEASAGTTPSRVA